MDLDLDHASRIRQIYQNGVYRVRERERERERERGRERENENTVNYNKIWRQIQYKKYNKND